MQQTSKTLDFSQLQPVPEHMAQEPAPARPRAARSASTTPARQARTAAPSGRSGAGRRQAATAAPDTEALWYELTQSPGDWYWNTDKKNDRESDYLSVIYFKDDGWPVGLWETSPRGDDNLPDDPDWRADFDAIPETAFAQERPRRRD